MMGMLDEGIYVSDCGMASTPAMFMSIVYPETRYDGACMITASHLPFNRNGLKFLTKTADWSTMILLPFLKLPQDWQSRYHQTH